MAIAGGVATVITGGWFLFQTAVTGTGVYCATHQTSCARLESVFNAIDIGEELSLTVKAKYQHWRGDEEGEYQTLLEIQMEHLDGGVPGNTAAKELGADTLAAVAKFGDDAVDLVRLYGVDAAEIIFKYQGDGIEALQNYGRGAAAVCGPASGGPRCIRGTFALEERKKRLAEAMHQMLKDFPPSQK